ncbi:MAG: hypothetical protein FWD83_06870 [Promicromonosporaceae bacterium]|nr:hypothetical protein [Promicromonosporaceae bacterium]
MISRLFCLGFVLLGFVPLLDIDPSVIGGGVGGVAGVSRMVGSGLFSDEVAGLDAWVRGAREDAAAVRFDGVFGGVIVLEAVDPGGVVESRVSELGVVSGVPVRFVPGGLVVDEVAGLSVALVVGVLVGAVLVGGGVAVLVGRSRAAAWAEEGAV